MNKKYLFDKTNVIDLSKLYDEDNNDTMFYWCNSCGEVNLPGDVGIVLHTEDELRRKSKVSLSTWSASVMRQTSTQSLSATKAAFF